jgi:acetylglutamate kinase
MAELCVSAEAFAAAVARVCAHPAATDTCLKSVATLNHLGVPVVLVHGGGKPIDRAMAEAGITPKKVAGRRYTDDATLEIVVRVLRDEINAGLVAKLRALGVDAFGASALPAGNYFLLGDRLTLPGPDGQPVDLGHVGAVRFVDDELIRAAFGEDTTVSKHGTLPVVPSIARDDDNKKWLNVNADTAASAVAGALKADKAIFLTDTPGVLRDRSNPNSLLPKLTERECRDLIASGVIDGGMVPKVEACFEALEAGAKSALILDGRVPFSLLDVFLHDTFKGTAITR